MFARWDVFDTVLTRMLAGCDLCDTALAHISYGQYVVEKRPTREQRRRGGNSFKPQHAVTGVIARPVQLQHWSRKWKHCKYVFAKRVTIPTRENSKRGLKEAGGGGVSPGSCRNDEGHLATNVTIIQFLVIAFRLKRSIYIRIYLYIWLFFKQVTYFIIVYLVETPITQGGSFHESDWFSERN